MVSKRSEDIPAVSSGANRLITSTIKDEPPLEEALTEYPFKAIENFQDYLRSIYYLSPNQILPRLGNATSFNLFTCGEYIFKYKEPHDELSAGIIVWKDESFVDLRQLKKRDRLVLWHRFICEEVMSKYPRMNFKNAIKYYKQNPMEFTQYVPPATKTPEELKAVATESKKVQKLKERGVITFEPEESNKKDHIPLSVLGFKPSDSINKLIRLKAQSSGLSISQYLTTMALSYLNLSSDIDKAEEEAKELLEQEEQKAEKIKQLELSIQQQMNELKQLKGIA